MNMMVSYFCMTINNASSFINYPSYSFVYEIVLEN